MPRVYATGADHPRWKGGKQAWRARKAAANQARSDALKGGPCVDCGGRFPPECMDWDHRPGEVKTAEVGALRSGSLERMLAEIAKCDLVCANCHRIRTRARGRA